MVRDVWIPEKLRREVKGSFSESPEIWFMLGRLKPGVSRQQAESDLGLIANRLAKICPQDYPARFTVQVRSLGDSVIGRFESTLYTVLAAVGLLLLIACSNVANLMLARTTTREKELVLRATLGAGRARLVRASHGRKLGDRHRWCHARNLRRLGRFGCTRLVHAARPSQPSR